MENHELRNCVICGKQIEKKKNCNWNKYAKTRYCSRACCTEGRKKRMVLECCHCGKKVERTQGQIKGRIFCSVACRKKESRPDVICAGCGKTFQRVPTHNAKKYCSWECFKASRWQVVKCSECGKDFLKRVSEIKKCVKMKSQNLCSRSCRNAYTSKLLGGDGTWVVGGKHGGAKTYGPGWKEAKMFTLQRDKYECQQCGATQNLEVHHWEPYNISFNNSPDNLVTLCKQCHVDKHEEYRREGFYENLER